MVNFKQPENMPEEMPLRCSGKKQLAKITLAPLVMKEPRTHIGMLELFKIIVPKLLIVSQKINLETVLIFTVFKTYKDIFNRLRKEEDCVILYARIN